MHPNMQFVPTRLAKQVFPLYLIMIIIRYSSDVRIQRAWPLQQELVSTY